MKNKYNLNQYLKQLKGILDDTDHTVAGEVCEHLWNSYFKFGIFPDPFYVESDVAIAELIQGKGNLKNAGETPDLEAEITIDLEDDVDHRSLTRLQLLMLRESYHLIKNIDGYSVDINRCINSRILQLFSNYSNYFGEKPND